MRQVTSPSSINDGQWHHVVATLGPEGAGLMVDGRLVGLDRTTKTANNYAGYWRLGWDSLSGQPARPSTDYLTGEIDDVAIYDFQMSVEKANSHYVSSGRTSTTAQAPSDTYGASVYSGNPDIYWRLDENSGAIAADASRSGIDGTYAGGPALNQVGIPAGGSAVSFDGLNDYVAAKTAVVDPRIYSTEAWFKTDTTRGGEITGFGSAATGLSTSRDRQVIMTDDGRLRFVAASAAIDSTRSFNDGAWHLVVATQGPEGMALYVDGQLVGENTSKLPSPYVGYWRVGGDSVGSLATSNYFAGLVDEVVIHGRVLDAEEIAQRYIDGSGLVPNEVPVAGFSFTPSDLSVAFDGSLSTDSDGTVVGWAWQFGDGETATTQKPSHVYAEAGSYQVKLTVTDDDGGTDSITKSVTVTLPVPNEVPVAGFSFTPSDLSVAFDGSLSTDSDGTVVGWAWQFGDGETATTQKPSHVYAEAGSYQVKLTVTDDDGGTDSITKSVTVTLPVPNEVPVAGFSFTPSDLSVAFDGSLSTDSDGTVVGWAWQFGDGETATTQKPSHVYAEAGSYQVKLTVTDDDGGTDSITKSVTVIGPASLAADNFERTVANGWGTADVGGTWSVGWPASDYSVSGGSAFMNVGAGSTRAALLNSVSTTTADISMKVSLDKEQIGSGTSLTVIGRRVSANSDYRMQIRVRSDRQVEVQLIRIDSGAVSYLVGTRIPSFTYDPGDDLELRFQVNGTSPTQFRVKVWAGGTNEPSGWLLSRTDSASAIQVPGSIGLMAYVAGTNTNGPIAVRFRDFLVVPVMP